MILISIMSGQVLGLYVPLSYTEVRIGKFILRANISFLSKCVGETILFNMCVSNKIVDLVTSGKIS